MIEPSSTVEPNALPPPLATALASPSQPETTSAIPFEPGQIKPASAYLTSSAVDEPAAPIDVAPLIYPEDPFLRKIPGKVILRVFISETGAVVHIDILQSDPPGLFEEAAIDSILDTPFRPARRFGQPVKNVKVIEVNFDPYRDAPDK